MVKYLEIRMCSWIIKIFTFRKASFENILLVEIIVMCKNMKDNNFERVK